MLPPGLQALSDGVQDHSVNSFGQLIVVLSGAAINQRFTGIVTSQEIIDPDMPLGADPRMVSALEVASQTPTAPTLGQGDIFRTDAGTRYKVLSLLDNNAASFTTRYRVEQQL